MKKEKYNVAIVGATGAVGEQMREVLDERQFPVGELRLLASERSVGQFLPFQSRQLAVQVLKADSFKYIDIGLFSAGGSVSTEFAPLRWRPARWWSTNTSVFRLEPDIPWWSRGQFQGDLPTTNPGGLSPIQLFNDSNGRRAQADS